MNSRHLEKSAALRQQARSKKTCFLHVDNVTFCDVVIGIVFARLDTTWKVIVSKQNKTKPTISEYRTIHSTPHQEASPVPSYGFHRMGYLLRVSFGHEKGVKTRRYAVVRLTVSGN